MDNYQRERRINNLVIKGLKIDVKDEKNLQIALENVIKRGLEIETKIELAYKINEHMSLIKLMTIPRKVRKVQDYVVSKEI